jgi:hypothetical protein
LPIQPAVTANVKFQSVIIPNNVPQHNPSFVLKGYQSNFTVHNYGSSVVILNWVGNSSLQSSFAGGTITIPANGDQTIPPITLYFPQSGNIAITYILSYNGTVLDTWTGTSYIISNY